METTPRPVKKGKRLALILAAIFIALILAAGACFYYWWNSTADDRLYREGVALLEAGSNPEAIAVFESLPDYPGTKDRILEARYAIAAGLLESGQPEEALAAFAQIPDYRDSRQQCQQISYQLASDAMFAKDHALAHSHFVNAGDYRDAHTQAQRMLYTLGHNAFLEEDYDAAFDYFSQLDGTEADYGYYHFITMQDAAEFVSSHREDLTDNIRFHISEEPDEGFYEAARNLLGCQTYNMNYYAPDQLVTLSSIHYYPGDTILDAWEKGDTSGLSEEEQQVLELALQLVEQAEAETDTDLEKEIWLHDWLCDRVRYESPDMDVSRKYYIQLRELSCIGAMLDGIANCQGYTDAFYLLGSLAGFEMHRLIGDTGDGHIWNIIRLDGQWYIADATFDDLSDGDLSGWTYSYFNAPWDPEVYDVFGDEHVDFGLATEFNADVSYFGTTEHCHDNLTSAIKDVVTQMLNKKQDWGYAMVEGQEIDISAVGQSLQSQMNRRTNRAVSWIYIVEIYGGSTFITVCWDT